MSNCGACCPEALPRRRRINVSPQPGPLFLHPDIRQHPVQEQARPLEEVGAAAVVGGGVEIAAAGAEKVNAFRKT